MKKILIILILFITSCGYQPIFVHNDQFITRFSKIILIGNEKINKNIVKSLNLKSNLSSDQVLEIKTNYLIEEKLKNSLGQVTVYGSKIQSQITIKKNDEEILQRRNFVVETTYNNKDNKFELSKYQDEIKANLTQKIVEEISLALRLI